MGSSSSRNAEAGSSSPGRQRLRRDRGHHHHHHHHHHHDACFFGRRHHHSNSEIKSVGRNSEASSSSQEQQQQQQQDQQQQRQDQQQQQDKYAACPETGGTGASSEYKRITGGIILDRYVESGPGDGPSTAEISLLPSDCQSPSSSTDDETKSDSSSSDDDEVFDGDELPRIDLERTRHASGGSVVEGSSSSDVGSSRETVADHTHAVASDDVTTTSSATTTSSSASRQRAAEEEQASSLRIGESRRNSGRRFWDALTRAASHRRNSTPITIVAIEEIDDSGSSTSRWNFQHWRASLEDGDRSLASRTADLESRRRHVRSHVWALQRLSGGLQVSRAHDRSCPASGHNAGAAGGLCSCEASSTSEDSSTRASISRIIMLAEALFEVLDEIHRQSVALSRSATMPLSSLPAPDEVVDSIPIRLFKNSDAFLEEAAQCHICLIEYEEDDEIRVLPCQHEYHKNCVDKWLKEVHRVCPLCRGDVCGPETDTATS